MLFNSLVECSWESNVINGYKGFTWRLHSPDETNGFAGSIKMKKAAGRLLHDESEIGSYTADALKFTVPDPGLAAQKHFSIAIDPRNPDYLRVTLERDSDQTFEQASFALPRQ